MLFWTKQGLETIRREQNRKKHDFAGRTRMRRADFFTRYALRAGKIQRMTATKTQHLIGRIELEKKKEGAPLP